MLESMEMVFFIFMLFCYAVCAFYALTLALSLFRAIFKKEKFTFRATIPFASFDPKDKQKPKHRMITAFVFPLLWIMSLDISEESIIDCLVRIANGTANRTDWVVPIVLFVSFYLWAGYIGYNGIPEKSEGKS